LTACPNCGIPASIDGARFCPHCGKELPAEKDAQELSSNQVGKGSVYLQGTQFEQMVQTIIEQDGYKTEKRKRAEGVSGIRNEIDIWAEKDRSILLIECKNYHETRSVGSAEIRDFKSKLDDLRQMHGSHVKGLFATSSHFSSESEQYAKHNGIELWEGSMIYDKYYKVMLGRGRQNVSIPLVLPLSFGYEDAIRPNLVNPDLVTVKGATLRWHPYFRIDYRIDIVRTLPNRNTYKSSDESFVVYDGETNESLSPDERGILYNDLRKTEAEANYRIDFDEKYHTEVIPQRGPFSLIKKLAVRRIIDEHTKNVEYKVKSRDYYVTKSLRVVPSNKEVLLKDAVAIYVPEWLVTFEVGGVEYLRKLYGSSGTLIQDELAYCSKNHGLVEKLKRHDDRAYAICEKCYMQFCKSHSVNLSNRYYCKEHDPTPNQNGGKSWFFKK
jgi:uncharacterized Zn finger protein (UPF0148 family)